MLNLYTTISRPWPPFLAALSCLAGLSRESGAENRKARILLITPIQAQATSLASFIRSSAVIKKSASLKWSSAVSMGWSVNQDLKITVVGCQRATRPQANDDVPILPPRKYPIYIDEGASKHSLSDSWLFFISKWFNSVHDSATKINRSRKSGVSTPSMPMTLTCGAGGSLSSCILFVQN